MQSSTKSTSCALAGKTVRACESCLKRRARWYCGSDDAFLCHTCDTSVHLANKLASRHKRVRLDTGSFKQTRTRTTQTTPNPNFNSTLSPSPLPPWQSGFTRKPRTPRTGKKNPIHVHKNSPVEVPEIGSDNEGEISKEDDQLIFSVPVFEVDHQSEFCGGLDFEAEFGISLVGFDQLGRVEEDDDDENKWVPGVLPSEAELADFAADVESLLVDGGGEQGILPLLDDDDHHKVEMNNFYDNDNCYFGMKVEDEHMGGESVVSSCWGLDFDVKFDEDDKADEVAADVAAEVEEGNEKKKRMLRLNYEAVMDEWGRKGSPWTSGCRPEFNAGDGWPNCMNGAGLTGLENDLGERGHVEGGDGGRGARVMRYREKRKSRLFSKKIRYEVRKLNAEKRPRLKGRFVKRATLNSNNLSSSSSSALVGAHRNFSYLKV